MIRRTPTTRGWQRPGRWKATVAVLAALGFAAGCDDTAPAGEPAPSANAGGAAGAGGVSVGGGGAGGVAPCGEGLVDCDGECLPECPEPTWGVGYDPARGADDDPTAPNPHGGAIYYIATDGSDANDGASLATPWATFHHANTQVAAGDLVYVRGGTYHEYVVIGGVGSNPDGYALGTSGAPITWRSYPGEIAILDGTGGAVVTSVLRLYGATWNVVQHLEVRNSLAAGIAIGQGSADNTVDNLWIHDNRGSGVGMGDSYRNRIVHVTSEDNYDEVTAGENADGFSVSSGGDHEFVGCLARHNSDDGYDLWESTGNVIRSSVATGNGYGAEGDGNGFKLGGATAGGGNRVDNCVAYDNVYTGFTSNTGSGNTPNTLYHCTGYHTLGSSGRNFRMYGAAHVLRNNLDYGATLPVQMETVIDDAFNSWNLELALTDGDFVSLDPADLQTTFLRPADGSPAIDVGTDVGVAYAGAAPDLGAFEHP